MLASVMKNVIPQLKFMIAASHTWPSNVAPQSTYRITSDTPACASTCHTTWNRAWGVHSGLVAWVLLKSANIGAIAVTTATSVISSMASMVISRSCA